MLYAKIVIYYTGCEKMINKIAVCDDSIEYRNIITALIKDVLIKNNLQYDVVAFNSGYDLIKDFKEKEFDIVFLDMEMPEINGIETGLMIREINEKTNIFYLTSHKEYAYESYKVKAKDYLLKPVSSSIIESNLLECIKDLEKQIKFLDVKDIYGTMYRLPINEVTHILRKKEDRKLHIYSLNEKEIIVAQTLESLENMLGDNGNIARANKSCLVNLENVRFIIKNAIYFSNDVVEYASRRCLPVLMNKFNLKGN